MFESNRNFHLIANYADYLPIWVALGFVLSLLVVIVAISLLNSTYIEDAEKISAYECGFNPFQDTHRVFEVTFYLIALLFILFDIEIAFLLPIVVIYTNLSLVAFGYVLSFLFILILGFFYEWRKGMLEWY